MGISAQVDADIGAAWGIRDFLMTELARKLPGEE